MSPSLECQGAVAEKTAWSAKLPDSVMLGFPPDDHCGNCGLWTFLLASGIPNAVDHAKAIRLITVLPSHSLLEVTDTFDSLEVRLLVANVLVMWIVWEGFVGDV